MNEKKRMGCEKVLAFWIRVCYIRPPSATLKRSSIRAGWAEAEGTSPERRWMKKNFRAEKKFLTAK
jgi:hypothetical protein